LPFFRTLFFRAFLLSFFLHLLLLALLSYFPFFSEFLQEDQTNPEWPHEEPSPVSFLIHFVGDCHQPLHVGYAYDFGGTTVSVEFFSTDTNLHDVWDTYIIEKWQGETSSAIEDIENLIANNKTLVDEALSLTTPSQWANQSFEIVRFDVYNYDPSDLEFDLLDMPSRVLPSFFLPFVLFLLSILSQTRSFSISELLRRSPLSVLPHLLTSSSSTSSLLSGEQREKHTFSEPYLGSHYYDHNLPIVQTQLLRGSVRLAVLLEELFG
jgi:hypothetical protein